MSLEIEIVQIEREEARKHIAYQLVGRFEAPLLALQAEAVRVALWALSRGRGRPLSLEAAVSGRTLLYRARQILQPYAEAGAVRPAEAAGASSLLQPSMLKRLHEQGDLLMLSQAKECWLPAPARLVPLGSRYVLAGGLPSLLLPEALRQQLRLHQTLRLLPSSAGRNWPFAFQSLASWLGPQAPSLQELNLFFQHIPLTNVDRPPDESDQIEIYLPWASGPQEKRWQPLAQQRSAQGRYLLRWRQSQPQQIWRYSIALLDQGRLRQEQELAADHNIPRFCYALDQAAGRLNQAEWIATAPGGPLALHLESRLPRREYRLLQALGEQQPKDPKDARPYRWRAIAAEDRPLVEAALQPLGVRLMERPGRSSLA
ncbi:hypothetical protein [Thermogemmatispora sp.]|uniref:hypothetical protein n=1 Tax=Thermogemmatispora sp. TaxID=1968838 RepID=UPI0035E43CE8